MSTPARILVVDDDPLSLDVLEANLQLEGYQVLCARDGVEALKLARQWPPDLVITDILMPNMDGYQLCREIRTDESLHSVPLVFYSATYTDAADQEFALSLGASRFVVKPEAPERLDRVIEEVLEDDGETGGGSRPSPGLDEGTYLHRYNRRLVAKLEDKLDELSRVNRRLEEETERVRRAESRLRHLAHHDPVTGAPNRTRFILDATARLHGEEASGRRLAVAVLDMNAFREVNHTLGYETGNRLLRMIADRLAEGQPADAVRPARIGHDVFALLLEEQDREEEFVSEVRRSLRRLEEPFELDGIPVEVSASAGVAVHPDDSRDVELLLRHAEVALRSERGSRGHVSRYRAELDPYQPDRLRMISGLRQAIAEGQLVLHYQPKLELRSSRPVGAEALVRWSHRDRGLLPPAAFVGLAEQTGQIRALTEWVVRSAVADVSPFAGLHRGFGLSVNVSPRNLLDQDLPETLERVLHAAGMAPSLLCVEITESAILRDPAGARAILDRLAGMGIGVAIDDFGTGYSSLSHLKELPVRELKIDRSFVTTMEEDPRDAAIVRSTVHLAHDLGLEVTAEGVETEPVLEMLVQAGCDMAQGYLMAPPLPRDELLRWMGSRGSPR